MRLLCLERQEKTWPTKRSRFVSAGSKVVPTPIRPPGWAEVRRVSSDSKLVTLENSLKQETEPLEFLFINPGRISISSPTYNT